VRQAITLLVHFPRAASGVAAGVLDALEGLPQPGVPLLRELLSQQREDPCETTAQLLERWRQRAEAPQLARLASTPVLLADLPAAAGELEQLLGKLADEGVRLRLDELLRRESESGWTEEEKSEFQILMARRRPSGPRQA
jgi:aryl carrier-like protein